MRQPIDFSQATVDFMVAMCEGLPGAASVLTSFSDPVWYTLRLEEMNMRGSQIWVAFKDFAGGDILTLEKALREKDRKMLAIVNAACPEEKAVLNKYEHTL